MLKGIFSKFIYSFLTVILGFSIGFLTTFFLGLNPLEVFWIFIKGVFATRWGLNWIFVAFPSILFCSLSFTLTFRSGVFNFGTPGQYIVGAIFAAIWGLSFDLHPIINVPLALFMGALGGALWTLLPAILRWKRNVNEIVTTLLLSFTAPILGLYVAKLPAFNDPAHTNFIATLPVKPTARLPVIVPETEVNIGLPIALVCALMVYVLLWKTPMGMRARAVGINPTAASYVGINTNRLTNLMFILSGGLAGLGGAIYILGVAHAYFPRTFVGMGGYGLAGIVAAFVGNMHPIGSIFSSFFFSILSVGGLILNIGAKIPVDYVVFIQGLILAFVSIPLLMKRLIK